MAYSNSARQLIQIEIGKDYTKEAAWNIATTYSAGDKVSVGDTNYVSLKNTNLAKAPGTSQSFWAVQPSMSSVNPPIFGFLCTGKTGAGDVVLKAIDDTAEITIPNTAFVVGVSYPIYLAKIVSAPAGMSFVGYR